MDDAQQQEFENANGKRLGQFLKWFTRLTIVILILNSFSMFFVFSPLGLFYSGAIACVIASLVWSKRQLAKGYFGRVIGVFCIGPWLLSLSLGWLRPILFPFALVMILLPVVLALPYLKRRGLALLLFGASLVTALCALGSIQPEPPLKFATLPPSVMAFNNAILTTAFAGLICLAIWHYHHRLTETISQAKNVNAALLVSERELEARILERTNELTMTRDEALEASQVKSTFLANMSHELRTPLNAIIGYSDLLLETTNDSAFAADLERINTSGKHLLDLINNILDISKIEAGRMEFYPESVDISPLLLEVKAVFQPQAQKSGNDFALIFSEADPVQADFAKLRQSLLHLLSNANKFTEQGHISLTVWQEPDHLYFAVQDTGIGMTPAELEKLFQPFTQTTRKYGGTGLGLALTKHFCQIMGGDVKVESAPEVGTTVTIILPVLKAKSKKLPKLSALKSV